MDGSGRTRRPLVAALLFAEAEKVTLEPEDQSESVIAHLGNVNAACVRDEHTRWQPGRRPQRVGTRAEHLQEHEALGSRPVERAGPVNRTRRDTAKQHFDVADALVD